MRAGERLGAVLLLVAAAGGCSSHVFLRPDGTPGPESCPQDAIRTMELLGLFGEFPAEIMIDLKQASGASPVLLYDGPVEGFVMEPFSELPPTSRLYGMVWTSGPHVTIRYYQARPPHREPMPVCLIATARHNQPLVKLPESRPGMAYVAENKAHVRAVDAFR